MAYLDFREQLAQLESSGSYDPPEGFDQTIGRYQFSYMRLVDMGLIRYDAEGHYRWVNGWSREKFLANESSVQDNVFLSHVIDICRRLDEPQYEGIRAEYSLPGLVGVAHLLGFSAMIQWAESDEAKKREFKDAYDTPGSSYYNVLSRHKLWDICLYTKGVTE